MEQQEYIHIQEDQSNQSKERRLKIIGITIILIVIVIGAIFLLGGTLKNPSSGDEENTQTPAIALSTDAMQPIESGEFVYRFEDISWEFIPENGQTNVRMMFENFSRRDSVYVTFGEPYKLGAYAGTCEETETMEINTERESGIALSFVECWSDTDGVQMAVFQEERDVVVKTRDVTRGELLSINDPSELPPFNEIYTVTLTEVVR